MTPIQFNLSEIYLLNLICGVVIELVNLVMSLLLQTC